MYLLRKAHVRAYDRVSKTGALQHIREHEDGRVRRYGLKLAGSKDSHDLHQIRRDRFGHLPHWNSLDEHTRHAVLDAEDEKARQHKEFEDWKDKVHGKKKPDAVKVDRSGWEQQLMFKARRVQHVAYILRKSTTPVKKYIKHSGSVVSGYTQQRNKHETYSHESLRYGAKIKAEAEKFSRSIAGLQNRTINTGKPVEVCSTPKIMEQLGYKQLPITVTAKILAKAWIKGKRHYPELKDSGKHRLTTTQLRQLPYKIAEPIMVLESAKGDGSIVLMLDMKDKDGDTVAVVISPDKINAHHKVNAIATIHGKDRDEWYLEEAEAGRVKYIDHKKSLEWASQSAALQSRMEGIIKANHNIPNEHHVVKPIYIRGLLKSHNPLHLVRRR